jgi:aerobic-type carbon monoxide dehydrogenase small subunit (CoxS/CutS family)|tara:strand:+ start:162 stop:617 length:456 start_codon:yes stop_codon:yes gene_type:complete
MPKIIVNNVSHNIKNLKRNLLSFLRFDLGLTGTKLGCGEGLCGACTILVDGQPLKSCMSTVSAVIEGSITTIEGLADGEILHPVQEAFIEQSAMQCGYCIPGFIMNITALFNREKSPTREQAIEALSENICRCGTYSRILKVVESLREKRQ